MSVRQLLDRNKAADEVSEAVPPHVAVDPVESAKAAGLRYVSDARPGIRREKRGDEFVYFHPDGREVSDEKTLARIRALGIPPAYEDVWICSIANGHLQATGRDARGRKQYRYHARWRETRDETKYGRMLAFADALPGIRAQVERDLARPGLGREKVLATVVRLLETTFIRVGNEEYARENNHFGLTTLHNEHVDVEGTKLHFHFTGKSGKDHEISVRDPRVAKIVRKIQDLPGEELFQYVDAEMGERHAIHSQDVNEYLHEITGEHFTAKDFRTWAGTLLCALALREEENASPSVTEARKNVVAAIKAVSERLGNTPAVCRKCYVHPAVLDRYLDGTMRESLARQAEQAAADPHALKPDEAAVMNLLRESFGESANGATP